MTECIKIMLDMRLARLEQRGASAVEYALLIAGIAAMIVLVMFAFGNVVIGIFQDTCTSIDARAHTGTC